MGAIYYMRILRTILLDPAPAGRRRVQGVTTTMRVPMIILAGLCVILGVAPQTGLSLVTPVINELMPHLGSGAGHMLATLPSLDVSWPVYVILPMIGAVVPIWFRRDRVKAGWGAAAILFLTTLHVLAFGQDLDTLSFIMALFIPAIGTVNLVYAVGYMEHSHTQWRFYAFFLLMTGGLLGVAASSDLFSFFTFWEIMSSWALYFAIAHEGTPEALREGFKYFLFNVAGAGFLFLGRRTQALSTLSWTTLGMLMVNPHMSRSFGFALSCAAVLGIVLFAGPLGAWLTPIMPAFIAQTMAMTIAAQLFTLPIQVLIEPELPVYSIPANLVVAPFVGFSTLAGLASLAISWILPSLGFIFASLASWGTAIMEFMALNLGSGDHATIPWTGDAGGALLIILVEIIGYTTARFAGTLFARITTTEPNLPGRRLIHNPIERAKAWGERTHNALKTMKWNE